MREKGVVKKRIKEYNIRWEESFLSSFLKFLKHHICKEKVFRYETQSFF